MFLWRIEPNNPRSSSELWLALLQNHPWKSVRFRISKHFWNQPHLLSRLAFAFQSRFGVQMMGKWNLSLCVWPLKLQFQKVKEMIVKHDFFSADPQRNDHQYLEETFILRCPLLKKFVDQDVNRETQVLYSLQHLMHDMEHPNSKFFDLSNTPFIKPAGLAFNQGPVCKGWAK